MGGDVENTKILIVEDETIVALDIKSAVKKLGYEVTDTATNHDEALASIKKLQPDIILMDVNLENSKDGIQTAKDIQKLKSIPIIYLTAYTDDETMKRAVETSPVGYLIKPFKREELKSTILLGLYKSQPKAAIINEDFEYLGAGFYYDVPNQNLYCDDIPMKLSFKEKKLLKFLYDAKNTIVSMTDIEHNIWPDEIVSGSSVRTLLYRLRTKLDHKLIETIPSFGCKLVTEN